MKYEPHFRLKVILLVMRKNAFWATADLWLQYLKRPHGKKSLAVADVVPVWYLVLSWIHGCGTLTSDLSLNVWQMVLMATILYYFFSKRNDPPETR